MAGTIRGRIECLGTEANEFLNSGVVFKNLYEVLNAHPQTTRIALQYGSGATGLDYPGEANPLGNGAFAVFRWDSTGTRTFDYYQFIGVAGVNSGAAPSTFGVQVDGVNGSSSSGYVYSSIAYGVGGDGNPWNGSENTDGTDTVGSPLWANPGGGGTNVQVCPASNSTSGSDGVNKNNCIVVYIEGAAASNVRHNIVCDDDVCVVTCDAGDNGSYSIGVLGKFTPNLGISPYPAPLSCWKRGDTSQPSFGTDLGELISGVTDPDTSLATWQAASLYLVAPTDILSTSFFPNAAGGLFDTFPLGHASDEAGVKGFRGEQTFVQATFGVPTGDTDTALELFTSGTATTNQNKEISPWDGTTTPGTGLTKQGVSFTRTP